MWEAARYAIFATAVPVIVLAASGALFFCLADARPSTGWKIGMYFITVTLTFFLGVVLGLLVWVLLYPGQELEKPLKVPADALLYSLIGPLFWWLLIRKRRSGAKLPYGTQQITIGFRRQQREGQPDAEAMVSKVIGQLSSTGDADLARDMDVEAKTRTSTRS